MPKHPSFEEFLSVIYHPGIQNQASFYAWEDSKNPYYVWEVIYCCAKHQMPLPDWVLDYLANCASRMMSDEAKQSHDVRKALPSILGFPTKKGPGNLLDPASDEPEEIPTFALRFAIELERGHTPIRAMRNATVVLPASEAERDEKTLWTWLKKYYGLTNVSRITAAEWKFVARAHHTHFYHFILEKFSEINS